jgi:hypothetical protein
MKDFGDLLAMLWMIVIHLAMAGGLGYMVVWMVGWTGLYIISGIILSIGLTVLALKRLENI